MDDISELLGLDVSRETLEDLKAYEALLRKWNPVINLVSKSTLDDAWTRHFVDSAQLFKLVGLDRGHWVDLGSGGGFPGLVCATLAKQFLPELTFALVESDRRKAEFLRTVVRTLDLKVTVFADRIESIEPQDATILTARALAPLPVLLGFADRHLREDGTAFFPKGMTFEEELTTALESRSFKHHKHTSVTDPSAVILEIGDIERG